MGPTSATIATIAPWLQGMGRRSEERAWRAGRGDAGSSAGRDAALGLIEGVQDHFSELQICIHIAREIVVAKPAAQIGAFHLCGTAHFAAQTPRSAAASALA